MKTKKYKILVIGAFVLFLIVFFAKGFFLAALVNGTPITRYSIIKDLEKQAGKQVLDSLITRELIFQESRKKGIEIKQSEVNTKVKKIEEDTSKQ